MAKVFNTKLSNLKRFYFIFSVVVLCYTILNRINIMTAADLVKHLISFVNIHRRQSVDCVFCEQNKI